MIFEAYLFESFAQQILNAVLKNLLNQFVIGLNPLNPFAAATAAARIVLNRNAAYLDRGVSFAIETTLSSRGRVDLLRNVKCCIARVRHRAARGGHFVPDADVRRRYARSIAKPQTLSGCRTLRASMTILAAPLASF